MRLRINKILKILSFGALLMMTPGLTKASHIIGGEILYKCLGNSQYEVTINVYRDCFYGRTDAPFDDPASVGIFDLNTNALLEDLRIPFMGDDTLNSLLADPCFIVPPTVCVHTTTYRDTVELLPRAGGYKLVYQRCCRNQTVNNIINPDRTGASYSIDVSELALSECNASPVFKEWPPIFICAGTDIDYDHGATDLEGDSLIYSLCTPNTGASFGFPKPQPPTNPPYSPVQWKPPYDLTNILGSGTPLQIDRNTGRLTGRPDDQGQYVVGICIEEYRDGVLLSRTIRDFQYNVGMCGMITASYNSAKVQCDNLEVTFTNNSMFADEYLWMFDYPNTDPAMTSSEFSPVFTYPDTGSYTVALIAQPNSTCVDTSFSDIFLQYNSLDADFEMVVFDCVDSSSVVVTDFSVDLVSPPVSWDWEFTFQSSGITRTSTEQHPVFKAPNMDTVEVKLTVISENGCISTLEKTIPTETLDPGEGIPDTIRICEGESVELNPNGLSNFNYFWSPADGLSATDVTNPTASPDTTITYLVEIYGDNRLCTKDQTVTVIVQPQPTLDFTTQLDCDNRTVIFTNNSVSTVDNYIWSFGDPANTTSNEINPTFTYPDTGTYNVTLTLDANVSLCSASVSHDAVVEDRVLTADFDVEYTSCQPGDVEVNFTNTGQNVGHTITGYNWNFGAPIGQLSGANQQITLNTSQTLNVEFEVITDQGCLDTISRDVDINLVEQVPSDTLQTCSTDSLELNPGFNPNYIYEWSPAIGFDANDPNPKIKLNDSQLFTVNIWAVGADTCEVLHQVDVTVPEPINLTASDDELTCDSTVTLVAASTSSTAVITWYDNNMPSVPIGNGSNLTVNVSGQTDYLVIAQDSFGCAGTKIIQVAGGPVDVAYPDSQSLCINEAYSVEILNLDANDNLTYSWTASPSSRIIGGADTANPTIDDSPGRFTLYTDIVSQFGCRYSDTMELVLVDTSAMDFDYEVQCDGLTVEFNDLSVNSFDLEWNFGVMGTSSDTSSLPNPTHTYPGLGGYWVLLSMSHDVSCRDSVLKFITLSDVLLEADFDVDYTGCSEDSITVQFNDRSFSLQNNISSFEWDFGVLGTTTDSNPSFTFYRDTIIEVTLSIENTAGCADEETRTIELKLFNAGLPDQPVVQCENLDLYLNPNGNPDYVYEWSPADKVDDPNAVNPKFTGTERTVFDVRILDIGVDTCEIFKQVTVEVPEPIRIDLSEDTTTCGNAILIEPFVNVPVTYIWIEGSSGDTLTRSNLVTVNPSDQESFILVTIDNLGCSLSDTIDVINRAVDIQTDNPKGICQNANTTVSVMNLDPDDTFTSVTWIPDNKILTGQGTQDVTVSTDQTGMNIFQVMVENQFGCLDTANVILNISEFDRGPDKQIEICAELDTEIYPEFIPGHQYIWSPAVGLDDPTNPNPFANLTDDITYTGVVTHQVDSLTCIDTVIVEINVQEPIMLELTPDDTLCEPQLTELQVLAPLSGLSFEWSDSPAFDNILGTDSILFVNKDGIHTFYVRGSTQDTIGCEYFGSITISTVPIDASPDLDSIACYQTDETIGVNNGNTAQNLTYNWTPADQIISGANTATPTVNLDSTTVFSVEVENQFGCRDTVEVPITVPVFGALIDSVTATPDSVVLGQSSQLEAPFFNNLTYTWEPSETLDNSTISDPIATPADSTTYTVEIEDENGCIVVRTVTVTVFDPICIEPYIFLPNAFSPNGDGENDVLEVLGQHIEEIELFIYDRWGQKVFETNDVSIGWDGTFKGKELSPDVYGFYLTVKCIDGEEFAKKGNVTLLR